jgi:hypothetical protein
MANIVISFHKKPIPLHPSVLLLSPVEKPARRGRKAADPVRYPLFHECVTFLGKIKSGDMITKNGNKINHKNNNKNDDSKSKN